MRFLFVGAWNTGFGYLSFALLYYLLSPRVHYMAILVASVVINVTNAYLGYKFLVFKTRGNYVREYLRFYLVYAVPIGIGLVAFPFAVEVLRINPYLAQAVITAGLALLSYAGHKYYSFRSPRTPA